MAQTTFVSYDQQGKKLSFANWISMISPQDTPFVSMTGKETINQTIFSWQVDALAAVNANNAVAEGSQATEVALRPTQVLSNVTQILRKVVKVSDTANTTANYGRGRELMYQLEKAGKEIKRDLEKILLSDQIRKDLSQYGVGNAPGVLPNAVATDGFFPNSVTPFQGQGTNPFAVNSPALDNTNARRTGAFQWLCATKKDASTGAITKGDGVADALDTGALTVKQAVAASVDLTKFEATTYHFDEADLFDLTLQLYTAGSEADIIMINPAQAKVFAALQETSNGSRQRIFENTKQFVFEVNTITDPLGQTYKVIVNRWMPNDAVYFFTSSDWTQMVLRAPQRTELAKDGSYEKWMIEMEVGLRHRNPYASGILYLAKGTKP